MISADPKTKCLPENRAWPGERCNRCQRFGYGCSANTTAGTEVQPTSGSSSVINVVEAPQQSWKSDDECIQEVYDLRQLLYTLENASKLLQGSEQCLADEDVKGQISIQLDVLSTTLTDRAKRYEADGRTLDSLNIRKSLRYSTFQDRPFVREMDDVGPVEQLAILCEGLGHHSEAMRLRETISEYWVSDDDASEPWALRSYRAFIERIAVMDEMWTPLAKLCVVHRLVEFGTGRAGHHWHHFQELLSLNPRGIDDIEDTSNTIIGYRKISIIVILIVHWVALHGRPGEIYRLRYPDSRVKDRLREWLCISPNQINDFRLPSNRSPIHTAAANGNTIFFENLSRAADLNAKDGLGNTPLHLAVAQKENVEVISLLVFAGADVTASNSMETPILHYAFSKYCEDPMACSLASVVCLFLHTEINLTATDAQGQNLLHWALKLEDTKSVEVLLKWTSVHRTDLNLKFDNFINQRAAGSITPLHLVAESLDDTIFKDDNIDMDSILSLLLSWGANVNIQDDLGETVLHKAMDNHDYCCEDMVLELMEAGFNVNLQDNEGLTPLRKAAKQSEPSLITTLIKECPELGINLVNMSGSTALHMAIDSEEDEVRDTVQALLQHPFIDTNLRDQDGHTPLDLAILKGYLLVVQDLVSAGARLSLNNNNGYGS